MARFDEFVKALADAWLMTCDIPEDDQPEDAVHIRWKIEQFADRHLPGYLDAKVEELVLRNQAEAAAPSLFDEVAS